MKKIVIAGGGASGMVAAIAAARKLKNRASIVILERNERIGKKLLSTGNGRCNLSNADTSLTNFHGLNIGFVSGALEYMKVEDTLKFFFELGLLCKITDGGRIYPQCEQASAVLDVLRNEIYRLGVEIIANAKITGIKYHSDFFIIKYFSGMIEESVNCDKLILALGGNAAPKTGSDGSGLALLRTLGHNVTKTYPALSQIKTENSITKSLKGIKVNCKVTAMAEKVILAHTQGEVIFAEYGLSGSAIFDISGYALSNRDVKIILDFLPIYSYDELIQMLCDRKSRLGHLNMEHFLTGILSKKLGQLILKESGFEKLSISVELLTPKKIHKLAKLIKELEFRVKGHNGWDNAQINSGGASSMEFEKYTMESKIAKGLYVVGEMYGFYGDCGGHNLQWAWSSGYLAGEMAAESISP